MDFSAFFQTKTQANEFLERLASLSEMTYQTTFQLENALTEHFGIEKKDKLLRLLHEGKVNTQSATALKAFLEKLREEIQTIPVLPLTIAFEPKSQTLKALSDWFTLNLQKQVLFDISVDRKLIAGAAITFNGKFVDFSVKAKFDKIVATHTQSHGSI